MKKDSSELYLTGKLLIAMPTMGDPRFHKSVIFVCAHDEHGAMGLVINQEVQGVAFNELLKQLDMASDIKVDLDALKLPVMQGGPVDNSRGFLLHSSDFKQKDTIDIDEQFALSGTIDALEDVARGEGPKDMLFILGYAGWTSGQLDEEIQQNAWLIADADTKLVFNEDAQAKWDQAVQQLGIDPAMLASDFGNA